MIALEVFLVSYLANALWQVPLLCIAAWCAARCLPSAGAGARHRIWVFAALLEVLVPAIPRVDWQMFAGWHWGLKAAPGSSSGITLSFGDGLVQGVLGLPQTLLAGCAALVLCIVAVQAARLLLDLRATWSLARSSAPAQLDADSLAIVTHCAKVLRVSSFAIAESSQVAGPVTIGVRHRLLILPCGFAAEVTAADFASAIAHEMAHMARHDFARNLIYRVLTLPVALHPALRFTLREIAATREMICDRLAADAISTPEAYARSLLRLASYVVIHQPAANLNAIGLFDANPLERRVMNLKVKQLNRSLVQRLGLAAIGATMLFGTCVSAVALRLAVATQTQQTDGAAAPGAARVSAGVMAGNILSKVQPVYPPEAKQAGIGGAVVLSARIGTDGSIEDLRVLSGPTELQASALAAVRQWKYKPYLLNGQPTEVETTITINYSVGR